MINFLSMKYFLIVAETKSFSVAAKQLYISQQTLSAHIAQIEKEVGTRLFERTRPLTLTYAGERFLKGISEMLFINTQMERDLQDIVDPYNNSFRLGISHAYARALLPVLLDRFCHEFPQVHLQIYEMSYKEMDEALAAGKVDLIITRPFYCGTNVKVIPLYEHDDVYLYAPYETLAHTYGDDAEHVLEELSRNAGLTHVKECPFILPRSGNVHENTMQMFMEAKIQPVMKVEVDTLETAIVLCKKGLGITVSPGKLLSVCAGGNGAAFSKCCYLLSRQRKEYAQAICYRENTYITHAMREFIEIVKEINH